MTNQIPTINWKITGLAGEGVMLASKLIGKSLMRHGWSSFTYFEYPSLIKGGHQTGQVLARLDQATIQKLTLDVLVVLNKGGWKEHFDEIDEHTQIIFNINSGPITAEEKAQIKGKVTELQVMKLATDSTSNPHNMNVVSVGISCKALGLDPEITKQVIADEFYDKDPKILETLLKAVQAGCDAIDFQTPPIAKQANKQIMLTGNEAVGLGALAAGVQFYSAYPMTPSTGLLQFLAAKQNDYPLVVKHAEDEIGAINHAIGASYAGVRSMTGSSGGGLALMGETVSFASIAELPLVILAAQRVGPATGLPTWTAQGDLQFILGLGHGDLQKIILTPGTIEEHYQLTQLAFYLAEKYQMPVFVLSDKHALEAYQTLPFDQIQTTIERQNMADNLPEDNSYLRYQLTEDGITKRSYPGLEHGLYLANSYEHDQWGYATELADQTKSQVDKRAKKLKLAESEIPQPVLLGPTQAELTIICWGSTVLTLQETLYQLKLAGQENKLNVIHLPCVWPFPTEKLTELTKNAKKIMVVEGNESGQLERLINQQTNIKIDHHYRRYDGRPFYSEDIIAVIDQL